MKIYPKCDEKWNTRKLSVEMDGDGSFFIQIEDGSSVKIPHHEFLDLCKIMPVLANAELDRVGFT